MTKEQAQKLIRKHNDGIDAFINGDLAKELNAKDGKISANDWFKAQQIIRDQGFYEKGIKVLREIRSHGFDVKMNMQSKKMVGLGIYPN